MNGMTRNGARTGPLTALALLAAALLSAPSPASAQDYDVIIRGGRVIDGPGASTARASPR